MKKTITILLVSWLLAQGQMLVPIVATSAVAAADTPWISAISAGTPRSNFDGCVGEQVLVQGAGITVTELGRWVVAGNSGTHTVYIMNSSGGSLGSVSINTVGKTAGQWAYTTLASPVVLSASTTYYVLSREANGGDQWLNDDTTITTKTAVANAGGSWYIILASCPGSAPSNVTAAPAIFVPVNFKYH